MTVFYPDVSHYQAGLRIQPGTVAVCAKASEGTTYRDPSYVDFKAQAAAQGALFFGYHWLHGGSIDAQAGFCYSVVGSTPVMIDCEDTGNPANVADCVAFAAGIRRRGGTCTLVYLPHWYWQGNLGSPSLTPLTTARLSLVSSQYTTYSDTGPGWAAYGGVSPVIWQFSESYPYGGFAVDMNAFRGTAGQLRTLVYGTTAAVTSRKVDDMPHLDLTLNTPQVMTSPTATGGSGWVCLSSDFGDARVRVAFKHSKGGWDIRDNVPVTSAGDHVVVAKIDSSITKISAVVQSLSTPNTAVGLDVLPDSPF